MHNWVNTQLVRGSGWTEDSTWRHPPKAKRASRTGKGNGTSHHRGAPLPNSELIVSQNQLCSKATGQPATNERALAAAFRRSVRVVRGHTP